MKRQDKLAKFLSIFIFVVFALATAAYAILPINSPKIKDKPDLRREAVGSSYFVLSGEIENPTPFAVKEMQFTINIYDEFEAKFETLTVTVKKNLPAGQTTAFEQKFMVSNPDRVADMKLADNPTVVYAKISWYFIAIAAFALWSLFALLFTKRKYYFEVSGRKVVVYTSFKHAAIIVDGVMVKKGKVPSFRQEVALFSYRIDGQSISIYTLNGALIPSIRITVNKQDVKFDKVRQNPFVRLMDEGVVVGQGNIEMRSMYDIQGEEADEYNEKRRQEKEAQKAAETKKVCPYCGTANDKNATRCSSCNANI